MIKNNHNIYIKQVKRFYDARFFYFIVPDARFFQPPALCRAGRLCYYSTSASDTRRKAIDAPRLMPLPLAIIAPIAHRARIAKQKRKDGDVETHRHRETKEYKNDD